MSEADWWLCPECQSLNNLSARKCYSCRAKKPTDAARASEILGYRAVESWDGKVRLEQMPLEEGADGAAEALAEESGPTPIREPVPRSIAALAAPLPHGTRITYHPPPAPQPAPPARPAPVPLPIPPAGSTSVPPPDPAARPAPPPQPPPPARPAPPPQPPPPARPAQVPLPTPPAGPTSPPLPTPLDPGLPWAVPGPLPPSPMHDGPPRHMGRPPFPPDGPGPPAWLVEPPPSVSLEPPPVVAVGPGPASEAEPERGEWPHWDELLDAPAPDAGRIRSTYGDDSDAPEAALAHAHAHGGSLSRAIKAALHKRVGPEPEWPAADRLPEPSTDALDAAEVKPPS